MVTRRIRDSQPSHAQVQNTAAPGHIVKGAVAAQDCHGISGSHCHLDPHHAFGPDDPWYDNGHNRARRAHPVPQDSVPSAPTVIASIVVRNTIGGPCDIEVTDVNGNITDHLPCLLERLQSLNVSSHNAGASSCAARTLASTESKFPRRQSLRRQSPRRSLRHSQRSSPHASRSFNAASIPRPPTPALTQRQRGGLRGDGFHHDQRMPSAKHKTYMKGGQLRIGDLDALHNFFYYRFFILEQNPCKKILKFLIDGIVHNKQTKYPYQGKPNQRRAADHVPDAREIKMPGFWLPGIPYTGPDRIKRTDRLTVLTHIMTLPLKDPAEWRSIVQGEAYMSKGHSYHECLLSILDERKLGSSDKPVLGDKDREHTDKDVHGNWRRHNARLAALREMVDIAGQVERCALEEIDLTHVVTYQPLHKDVEYTKGKQDEDLKSSRRPRSDNINRSPPCKFGDAVQYADGDGDTESSDQEDWPPVDDFHNDDGHEIVGPIVHTHDSSARTGTEPWVHVTSDMERCTTQSSSAAASFGSSFAASYDGDAAPFSAKQPRPAHQDVPPAPKPACAEAVRPTTGLKRCSAADQGDRNAKSRTIAEVKAPTALVPRTRDGARGRTSTHSSRSNFHRSTSASPATALSNQYVFAGQTGVVDDSQHGRPTPSLRYTSTQYYPAVDYARFKDEVDAGQHVPSHAHSGFQPSVNHATGDQAFSSHVPMQPTPMPANPPTSDPFFILPQNIDPQLMDTKMTEANDSFHFGEAYPDYMSLSGFPSWTNSGANYGDQRDFNFMQPDFYANGAARGSYYRNNFA